MARIITNECWWEVDTIGTNGDWVNYPLDAWSYENRHEAEKYCQRVRGRLVRVTMEREEVYYCDGQTTNDAA